MGNTNKQRGNKWEYAVRDLLQEYYTEDIVTTRSNSVALDNEKHDLMFKYGPMPYPPQCKSTQTFEWKWLSELPLNGIVFWKRMKKVNKNQKTLGKYVVLYLDTMLRMNLNTTCLHLQYIISDTFPWAKVQFIDEEYNVILFTRLKTNEQIILMSMDTFNSLMKLEVNLIREIV